jgi:hypothetical protein
MRDLEPTMKMVPTDTARLVRKHPLCLNAAVRANFRRDEAHCRNEEAHPPAGVLLTRDSRFSVQAGAVAQVSQLE